MKENYEGLDIFKKISSLLESSYGVNGKSKLISLVLDYNQDSSNNDSNNNNVNNDSSNNKVLLSTQKVLLTNDGLTIIRSLSNDSPIYNILLQQCTLIKNQFGVGVSQFVIILNGILQRSMKLMKQYNIHSSLIIDMLRRCKTTLLSSGFDNLTSIKQIDIKNDNILESIIKSNLSGNVLGHHSNTVLKLIKQLMTIIPSLQSQRYSILSIIENDEITLDSSNSSNLNNTSLDSSFVLDGIMYPKTFTFAGSETLSKSISNPKILLLNNQIELKNQNEYSKIEIDQVDQFVEFINSEKKIVLDQLANVYDNDIQMVLNKRMIGDLAIQEFSKHIHKTKRPIQCSGNIPDAQMKSLQIALGGAVQSTLNDLSKESRFYGTCRQYQQILIGKKKYECFSGCGSRYATIVLRGSSSRFLEEAKTGIQDCIKAIQTIVTDKHQVAIGGGAFEIQVSKYLQSSIATHSGKEKIILNNIICESIEYLVQLIGDNSGHNGLHLLKQLQLDPEPKSINIHNGSTQSLDSSNIFEPLSSKLSILNSSLEIASLLLQIDLES
ncbi:hypothetical protein CYY_006890 [Polysphondylium violaceum]|uniref:TCP-1-eta n=1 Tax=Polysphondylium violaceum TaxID=133409 RepID=A0A8J4PQK2_9MYCE|nr:hypothetical protein CYY_006890 [Polysphondylium violaceum]